ncbi:hypothetical protein EAI30_00275 [Romboutsia ilealis]|uniref:Polysaccharide deacetylase family protein n=1 Tax=Romboutsia faecis TaxID=2764597 RepID=A0ABR7JM50_9FIRM|nr:polysaccharide deacetylase family protein [Romboutsia faecis]MBC5995842.1 polysaccharide deacetylase family protein [Romboutsia faecis]MRN23041.1 hypothetical protein [Romboutsia ilealis]
MNRRKLSKIVFKISRYIGFNKLCYLLNKGRKRILMYHNIIPDEYFDDSINLEYSISESRFKNQIDFIEKRFKFGLDLENPNEVTITFDDGYQNQYSIGSKILDNKNIKGYFFCSESLINNDRILLIDKIQLWFDYVPYRLYKIDRLNLSFNISNREERKQSWSKVQDLIFNNKSSMEEVELSLNEAYPFNKIEVNKEFYKLRFNSIKESDINQMKDKGHKVGAHSSMHNILSNMNIKKLDKDIKRCVQNVGGIYNTDVFCYPFGTHDDVSDEVIDIVKSNKFKMGLASINSPNDKREYSKDFIPRIDISSIDDKYHIDFILSGARYLIRNKKLLPPI